MHLPEVRCFVTHSADINQDSDAAQPNEANVQRLAKRPLKTSLWPICLSSTYRGDYTQAQSPAARRDVPTMLMGSNSASIATTLRPEIRSGSPLRKGYGRRQEQ